MTSSRNAVISSSSTLGRSSGAGLLCRARSRPGTSPAYQLRGRLLPPLSASASNSCNSCSLSFVPTWCVRCFACRARSASRFRFLKDRHRSTPPRKAAFSIWDRGFSPRTPHNRLSLRCDFTFPIWIRQVFPTVPSKGWSVPYQPGAEHRGFSTDVAQLSKPHQKAPSGILISCGGRVNGDWPTLRIGHRQEE